MYRLNQTIIKDEDEKECDTYGISFDDIVIEDISINKQKIEKLVNLCNELELSPIHIYDVIDDFLVELDV